MSARRPVNRVTSKRRPAREKPSPVRATTTRASGTAGRTITRRPVSGSKPAASAAGRERASLLRRILPQHIGGEPRSSRSAWRTAVLCSVAAVLLAAFAAVAALRPGVDDGNRAYVDNKATDEVKAAASSALTKVFGYDVKTIDGYKAEARTMLTGKMLDEFEKDKLLDTGIDAIKQTRTRTDVHTDPIGVTLLTDDRAELLVNLNVSATKDGVPQQTASGPIVLRMQKVDGRWLAAEVADQ